MKKIRKAVIPAAGWGTRFLPATKATPKEMLPIVDTPTIQYIVEEAVKAGIEDICIITSPHKKAIEDHFDRSLELENLLERDGKTAMAESVKAIGEIARDLRRGAPMNRLVQGDVGSGKTMVAAAAAYLAANNHYQAALMAPTEILAEQHLRTMQKFLEPCGLRVGLLTGSMTAKQKRTVKAQLQNAAVLSFFTAVCRIAGRK